MKIWIDLAESEYRACRVTSYHGGATWLWNPEGKFYVVPVMTPVEILRHLTTDPANTVRAEVL